MFLTKTLCRMFFQTCLKGFKLKKLVVEPKTTQPVELDEEPVNPQLNRSMSAKQPFLSSRTVVQPVNPYLNRSRSGQGAVEVQLLPAKIKC